MKMSVVRPAAIRATPERYCLAEGPQWNAEEQTVSWVDIEGRTLNIASLDSTGELSVFEQRVFSDRVTFAHPLQGGRYLIGLGRQLAISTRDGISEESAPLVPEGSRLNDAVIDPSGRLIVGSMSLDGSPENQVLLRIENDGSVSCLDDDLGLSNGLGFSPDGDTFYSIDSMRHVVFRRDYEARTGKVGPRSVFATVDDCEPDGLAVDASGDVWVALWGGAGIQRFHADGDIAELVEIGPAHITSLAFVTQQQNAVVVTSSMLLLDDEGRGASPLAGSVFSCSWGATGQPPHPWLPLELDGVARST